MRPQDFGLWRQLQGLHGEQPQRLWDVSCRKASGEGSQGLPQVRSRPRPQVPQHRLGEMGPIGAKLLEYGARDGPNPHAVVSLVLGVFGELSNSCYSLCKAITRVKASRVLSFSEMSPKNALVLCKQKTLRFWGLTAQCGWARLILNRFHDFVQFLDRCARF